MKYFKNIFILICCVLPIFLVGCKPIVTITAPAKGDTFAVGETITFEGQATDPLHPELAEDAFVWTSDKDGRIGTGISFKSSDLSEGEHTITLTVTDPAGQSGQSSVSITVTATGDRFKDNGDGTVTDTRTGLIWLKNANPFNGYKTWEDAGTYCANLASGTVGLNDGSVAGDWRLPSAQELEGIGTDPPITYCIDDASCNGMDCPVTWTMPGAPFTNAQEDYCWSDTEVAGDPDYAWVVNVGNGGVGYGDKSYNFYLSIWPVRDGN